MNAVKRDILAHERTTGRRQTHRRRLFNQDLGGGAAVDGLCRGQGVQRTLSLAQSLQKEGARYLGMLGKDKKAVEESKAQASKVEAY